MKKFNPEERKENLYVEVVFKGSAARLFKCFGVLVREDEDILRIAFNAANDRVLDYLDIPVKNVDSLREVVAVEYLQKI